MEQRQLGKTALKVSKICLGTMTFGEQNTAQEGLEQMNYAVENGVNFFDTAELYAIPPRAETYGRTEEIVGQWIKESGKRHDVVIATKVVGPAPHMTWIREGKSSLTCANIEAAVEGSLKRLNTDYIDLYQIHWPQRPVNSFGRLDFDSNGVNGKEEDTILETLETMQDLIRQGKVRHIGLSNETPWGVMTYLRLHREKNLPRVESIQNPYSLLNRTFDVGLSEIAMHEKVGLLAYAPLAAGTLTGKYLNGNVPAKSRRAIDSRSSRYKRPLEDKTVTQYIEIAKKHGLDPAQMAIAFVCSRPHTTSAIIGATTMEQLKTNIGAANINLSAEIIADINRVHDVHPNPCP